MNAWKDFQPQVLEIAKCFDELLTRATVEGCLAIVTAGFADWVSDAVLYYDEILGTAWSDCLVFPQDPSKVQEARGMVEIPIYSQCGELCDGGSNLLPKYDLFVAAVQKYGKGNDLAIFVCGEGAEEQEAGQRLRREYSERGFGTTVCVRRVVIDKEDIRKFKRILQSAHDEIELLTWHSTKTDSSTIHNVVDIGASALSPTSPTELWNEKRSRSRQ